jgi:hypothetical protein
MEAPVDRCADALNLLEVIGGLTGRCRCAAIAQRHGFAPLAWVTPATGGQSGGSLAVGMVAPAAPPEW